MKPYYSEGGITIYHGDCREIAPALDYDAIVCDAPYGVGVDYGAFEDTPENVRGLATDLTPTLLGAKRACVFTGVPQMWLWPQPKWVLCWDYWPRTNAFTPWGFGQWQPILCYGADPYLERGLGPQPTVFRHAAGGLVKDDRPTKLHPCPKPAVVMRWTVNRVTAEDDVVLDLFMGSGETLRAAKDMGRRAIGIEIEERYCEIAANRLSQGVLDFGGSDA